MNIFFTFDYELVLGKNVGTVESCLIKPTKAYTELFEKYDVQATYFVDGAYLLKLKELGEIYCSLEKDYEEIVNNILLLYKSGHSIQYHFHPQWLYSTFENGTWNLDFEHYKMSDMEESYLQEKFREGLHLLKAIVGQDIVVFRAGGYSLLSYSNYIDLFKANGIRIDSSVTSGKRLTKLHEYDYSKAPQITHWQFEDDLLTPEKQGFFHEYRIKCTKPYGSLRYLLMKRRLEKLHKPTIVFNDGMHDINKMKRFKELFFKLFERHSFQACVDGAMAANLIHIFDESCASDDNMVIIGHPKCTTDASLVLTEQFIKYAKDKGCSFRKLDESLLKKS